MISRFHKNEDRKGVYSRCISTIINDDGHFACEKGLSLTLRQIALSGGGIVERKENGVILKLRVHAANADGSFKTETLSSTPRIHNYDLNGKLVRTRNRTAVAEDLPRKKEAKPQTVTS